MEQDKIIIVYTSYPNIEEAEKLTDLLIKSKLAACLQMETIKSVYLWKNNLAKENEVRVSIKSKQSLYTKLEEFLIKTHPYETPEIISIVTDKIHKQYEEWINGCLDRTGDDT